MGATIVHRVLTRLFEDRGVELQNTYQLNFGGNTDFLNMLERERLESKKISKTNAVTSQLDDPIDAKHVQAINARNMAITATADSASIAPYPTMRVWVSRAINLGVVPLEIKEWKPLTAPHAIVINAKGKSFPANTGPVPSMKRVSAGMCRVGRSSRIPTASSEIVPSFTNVLR